MKFGMNGIVIYFLIGVGLCVFSMAQTQKFTDRLSSSDRNTELNKVILATE
jgi:hypothetical protein